MPKQLQSDCFHMGDSAPVGPYFVLFEAQVIALAPFGLSGLDLGLLGLGVLHRLAQRVECFGNIGGVVRRLPLAYG